jgi:hypothetical protein
MWGILRRIKGCQRRRWRLSLLCSVLRSLAMMLYVYQDNFVTVEIKFLTVDCLIIRMARPAGPFVDLTGPSRTGTSRAIKDTGHQGLSHYSSRFAAPVVVAHLPHNHENQVMKEHRADDLPRSLQSSLQERDVATFEFAARLVSDVWSWLSRVIHTHTHTHTHSMYHIHIYMVVPYIWAKETC